MVNQMERKSLLVGLRSGGGDVKLLLDVLGALKVGSFHVKLH